MGKLFLLVSNPLLLRVCTMHDNQQKGKQKAQPNKNNSHLTPNSDRCWKAEKTNHQIV